jgi:5-methyltetrahydropteroyltriglutamate--homocysteine methyltransferase
MKVGIYFLEYDNARSGSFEPMRLVPPGKLVVLGLVASKVPTLESADLLKRRIEEASRYIRLEQLALSPQCGFNSGGDSGLQVGEDDQWRKFERILETAREVWGSA